METTNITQQTYNATDLRFRLGAILDELERKKKPVLIISRSKPRAWLVPYDVTMAASELFDEWGKDVLPKYKKVKASELIKLIRQDRERR